MQFYDSCRVEYSSTDLVSLIITGSFRCSQITFQSGVKVQISHYTYQNIHNHLDKDIKHRKGLI